MLEKQQALCAICSTDKPAGRHNQWHIDHDHKTGIIRALLCSKCNALLGMANDDPAILRAAADYIESHKE